MTGNSKVYEALTTLRNIQDDFAVFEHNAHDRDSKKLYSKCRKQISDVVESLERSVLHNHGKHGAINMGIDTGGTINTTTSMTDVEKHR